MNDGLGACLNAGHVVAHGVHARLGWVDLDNSLELGLAARKLVLPEGAHRLALFDDEGLGILSVSKHLIDEVWLVKMWSKSRLMEHPSWRKPSSNSSSHFNSFTL